VHGAAVVTGTVEESGRGDRQAQRNDQERGDRGQEDGQKEIKEEHCCLWITCG
jgi:hypothetical protein